MGVQNCCKSYEFRGEGKSEGWRMGCPDGGMKQRGSWGEGPWVLIWNGWHWHLKWLSTLWCSATVRNSKWWSHTGFLHHTDENYRSTGWGTKAKGKMIWGFIQNIFYTRYTSHKYFRTIETDSICSLELIRFITSLLCPGGTPCRTGFQGESQWKNVLKSMPSHH